MKKESYLVNKKTREVIVIDEGDYSEWLMKELRRKK